MRASSITAVLTAGVFSMPIAAQVEVFSNGFEPGDYPWSSCSGCPSPGGCFEIDRGEPWAGAINPDLVTLTRYANDAFLGAVEASATTIPSGSSQSVSFWVEQVTVATVGYTSNPGSFRDFWVADATAAMRVYLTTGFAVHPGDRISFTATEVTNYFGEFEITALSGLVIDSVDNPVFVPESNAVPFSYSAEGREVHRVFGEVTATLGACGSSFTCFDLTHERPLSSFTSVVRTSQQLEIGDCVEIVGPVNIIAGETMFNISNTGWLRVYGSIP